MKGGGGSGWWRGQDLSTTWSDLALHTLTTGGPSSPQQSWRNFLVAGALSKKKKMSFHLPRVLLRVTVARNPTAANGLLGQDRGDPCAASSPAAGPPSVRPAGKRRQMNFRPTAAPGHDGGHGGSTC